MIHGSLPETPERSTDAAVTLDNRNLVRIAVGLVAVAVALWILSYVIDQPILRFAGIMSVASTFVPLPADSYVLDAATRFSALSIGIVGGAMSAIAVLFERAFLQQLMHRPGFDRVRAFVGHNRFVDYAEKHLFIGLLIAAISPLPFEVFRLVAVTRDYNASRYALATFLGRGTRFFLLASVGVAFAARGFLGWVVLATLVAFAVGLVVSIRRSRHAGQPLPVSGV